MESPLSATHIVEVYCDDATTSFFFKKKYDFCIPHKHFCTFKNVFLHFLFFAFLKD
jgi:hypothetical protein